MTTNAKDSIAELDGAMKTYTMPASALGSAASILVTRNNEFQVISWATAAAEAEAPTDVDFAVFEAPASGNTLSVSVPAGLADGDKVYFKVKSGDESRTVYYGYTISAGNTASITAVTIGDESVADFGTPGTSLTTAPISGANGGVTYDYQGETLSAYPLGITASDGGSVEYVVTVWRTSPAPAGFASTDFVPLTAATTVEIENRSVLLIKVTSANGKTTVYYRINILLKNKADVEYGQPAIAKGVAGAAPALDPLWDEADWLFDVSRVNIAEMNPAFKFLNTVDGAYEVTGYGHTQGRAKAFWDDSGLYVYAEMTYHDFYNTPADQASNTLTSRVTALSPTGIADSNIHLYDSLEIFTNERVQTYTSGNYGIQYRVAPADTTGGSRISGNDPTDLTGNVAAFRTSDQFYSWIRKDSANKELGYSIIAKIPWRAKGLTEASDVFGTDGLVKAALSTGPKVGVEFQLNTTSTGGTRDSILTWNGIGGQSYQQCRNYGQINLILGPDGEARRRGDPGTVTFNKNSYAPGTEAEPPTITVDEAGGSVGTLPTALTLTAPWDAGVTFGGWNTRADGTGTDFTATTSVNGNITVYAKWVFTPGTIAVDGDTLVHTLPVTGSNKNDTSTSLGDVQGSWNANNTLNLDGSVTVRAAGSPAYGGGALRYMWPKTGLPAGVSIEDYDFVVLDYVHIAADGDTPPNATAMSVLYKKGVSDVDYRSNPTTGQSAQSGTLATTATGGSLPRFALKLAGHGATTAGSFAYPATAGYDSGISLQRGNGGGGTTKFLKATFSKGTRFNITLDANGGTIPGGVTSLQAVQAIAITDLPDPTRANFKFTGWSDGTTIYGNDTAMPANDIALTAQWIPAVAVQPLVVDFRTAEVTGISASQAIVSEDGTSVNYVAQANYGSGFVFKITLPEGAVLANYDKVTFNLAQSPDAAVVGNDTSPGYKNMNIAGSKTALSAYINAENANPAFIFAHRGNRITNVPAAMSEIIDKSKVLTLETLTGEIYLAFMFHVPTGQGYTITNLTLSEN